MPEMLEDEKGAPHGRLEEIQQARFGTVIEP